MWEKFFIALQNKLGTLKRALRLFFMLIKHIVKIVLANLNT